MKSSEIISLLLTILPLSVGSFLGILANKLNSVKGKTKGPWLFYVLGALVILSTVILPLLNTENFNPLLIILLIASLASGFILIYITRSVLDRKNIYKTQQLDPIINTFTENADKNDIKLFGGDLNFLGDTIQQINGNSQYACLRKRGFDKIYILCEKPVITTQKIRYGKIISDIPAVELKFYNPRQADLKVRGRICSVQGVDKLLMYFKIEPKVYQAIETDTSDSNGALYKNIWELVWSLAETPDETLIRDCNALYNSELR